MNTLFLACIFSAVSLANAARAPKPPAAGPSCGTDGWTWLLQEEFTGALNAAIWTPQLSDGFQYGIEGWGNSELEWYRADNIATREGNLVIKAQPENATFMLVECIAMCKDWCEANGDFSQGCKDSCVAGKSGNRCAAVAANGISSGRIRTFKKFKAGPNTTFATIRFEVRAQMPKGAGLWPAIWALPDDGAEGCSGCSAYGGWPRSGEIDIQESVNQAGAAVGTIHYGDYWPNNKMTSNWAAMPSGFNIHAVEWSTAAMKWTLNGQQFLSTTSSTWYTQGETRSKVAPFDKPFHLLINLAVGGGWPAGDYKSTTGTDLTANIARSDLGAGKELLVDYVRVCAK